MEKDEFEVALWGIWRRLSDGDVFSFMPAPYNNANFKEFNYCLLQTSSKRTFEVGYKVYIDDGKPILQIVNDKYQIKSIDRRITPAKMILLDHLQNEVELEAQKTLKE